MKKRILSIFLLLAILCLVSCQKESATSGETTTGDPNDHKKPVENALQLYTPYMVGHTFDDPAMLEALEKMGDSLIWAPSPYPGEQSQSYVEENIPDIVWKWDGMELVGKYKASGKTTIGQELEDSRYYEIDGYGVVAFDIATGDWVRTDFRLADLLDQDPTTEKLTQDECQVIALAHIDNYIATIGTDIDLNEYQFRAIDLQGTKHKFYTFFFDRYIDGYRTDESIGCSITEYGSLITFVRNHSFDSYIENKDKVDYDAIYESLNKAVQKICDCVEGLEVTYSFGTPSIQKFFDGTYQLELFVLFNYVSNGTPASRVMYFRIPLTHPL